MSAVDINEDCGDAWISTDVQAILDGATDYSHDDLWKLIRAWYDAARAGGADWSASQARAQCAYELSALIGPWGYARTPPKCGGCGGTFDPAKSGYDDACSFGCSSEIGEIERGGA